MWIHTDRTQAEIFHLATDTYGVRIEQVAGSASHYHKLRVYLVPMSHLTPEGGKRRRTNSGNSGAGYGYAATYNEWGEFLAALFELDFGAKTDGHQYNGRADFHEKTGNQFLPKTVAQKVFEATSDATKLELVAAIFHLLEFDSDGNAGREWDSDTLKEIGEEFVFRGIEFTSPEG